MVICRYQTEGIQRNNPELNCDQTSPLSGLKVKERNQRVIVPLSSEYGFTSHDENKCTKYGRIISENQKNSVGVSTTLKGRPG